MTERELRVLRKLANEVRALREEIKTARQQRETEIQAESKYPTGVVKAEVQTDPVTQQAIRNYYDSESHERSSWWGRNKRWFETGGVIAAGVLAFLTYFTFREIRKQTIAAKDTAATADKELEADTRPWIKINSATVDPPTKDAPTISFIRLGGNDVVLVRTAFSITNIGKGVAQNIAVYPAVVLEKWNSDHDTIPQAERRTCESPFITQPLPQGLTWSAVFPGDPVTTRISPSAIVTSDLINNVPGRGARLLTGEVIVCIGYQYPRRYQTAAVFRIMGQKDRFFEFGKNLSAASVHLLRDDHYEYAQ